MLAQPFQRHGLAAQRRPEQPGRVLGRPHAHAREPPGAARPRRRIVAAHIQHCQTEQRVAVAGRRLVLQSRDRGDLARRGVAAGIDQHHHRPRQDGRPPRRAAPWRFRQRQQPVGDTFGRAAGRAQQRLGTGGPGDLLAHRIIGAQAAQRGAQHVRRLRRAQEPGFQRRARRAVRQPADRVGMQDAAQRQRHDPRQPLQVAAQRFLGQRVVPVQVQPEAAEAGGAQRGIGGAGPGGLAAVHAFLQQPRREAQLQVVARREFRHPPLQIVQIGRPQPRRVGLQPERPVAGMRHQPIAVRAHHHLGEARRAQRAAQALGGLEDHVIARRQQRHQRARRGLRPQRRRIRRGQHQHAARPHDAP